MGKIFIKSPFLLALLFIIINAQELAPKVTLEKKKLIILAGDDHLWENIKNPFFHKLLS